MDEITKNKWKGIIKNATVEIQSGSKSKTEKEEEAIEELLKLRINLEEED